MSICYAIGILALVVIVRAAFVMLFSESDKKSGGHSDWTIIGNGWGVYDREYEEVSHDL